MFVFMLFGTELLRWSTPVFGVCAKKQAFQGYFLKEVFFWCLSTSETDCRNFFPHPFFSSTSGIATFFPKNSSKILSVQDWSVNSRGFFDSFPVNFWVSDLFFFRKSGLFPGAQKLHHANEKILRSKRKNV